MNLADLRRHYERDGLRRREVDPDPIVQFQRWLREAIEAGLREPNAMTLATVSEAGQPSGRTVLLKEVSARGFSFFTNYESRKARELAANPRAGLTFLWLELERQVCVTGAVSKLPREESERYFRSRPRGSRLGAWVSRQSEPVPGRVELEAKLREVEARHPGEEVPCPPNWGGYVLAPAQIEFWQGRPDRLHDRLCYTRQADGTWRIERLSP
jgi:pyridoxamine 5'-phosphate oxidase